MLQTLREKPVVKKLVLSAVLVVMVLGIGIGVTSVIGDLLGGRGSSSSMGTSAGPWAMRIGSETITPLAFQTELRAVANELSQMGMSDSPDLQTRARFEAMQRIVRRALETKEAHAAGLVVTDRELSDRIVSLPELQRDGQFIGRDEYQRLLARNELEVGSFESKIRDGILIEKWEALVGAGAIVTDREVEEEFAHRNQKIRYDFVLIDTAKYAPAAPITDAELKAHYDTHLDSYQKGEARRASYVLIDPKDSESQIPPPPDDEIKKAYETDPNRNTASFEDSKERIRRQIVFQKAQAEADRRAALFRATVTDPASFSAAAAKAGLRVQDTGSVLRDSDAVDLGPPFLEALFAAAPASVAGPVKTLKGSAVFVLVETQPARRATFEEAQADLRKDVSNGKGRDAALGAARRAVTSAGGDLAKVAQALSSTVQNGPLVSKGEPVPPIGYDPAVEGAAFATDPGSIAPPVATSGGSIVVLKVAEKKTPDAAGLAASREAIMRELRRSREMALVNSILEAALKRTELKTNDEYFRQFGA